MLTIGEFSKISRVSAKTLRYYDQIGLIKPGHVSRDTGYRYYEVSQLQTMLLIARLKQYSFSLPEIAVYLSSRDEAYLLDIIQRKKYELSLQILNQRRIISQMENDIEKIERCENFMQTEYNIKTVDFKPVNIYSIRKKIGMTEFEGFFGELCAGISKYRLTPSGPCFSIYYDEEFNRDSTDVELSAIVSDSVGENVKKFDPGFCCCATRVGPYDDFSACYAALAEWIDREGYVISGPAIEMYIKTCQDTPPEECVTEIYFPIKKR